MTPFEPLRARLAGNKAVPAAPGSLETSVAVMLSPGPRGLDVLLIRRAVRAGDPWSGHIGLPGGRRDPADTGLLDTALRETLEEIGVDLPGAALLGALDDVEPSVPSRPPLVIRPFVFGLESRPETRASVEVAASYWTSLRALQAATGSTKVQIADKTIEVPCFDLSGSPEGLVVWGLTYRILCGLNRLLD